MSDDLIPITCPHCGYAWWVSYQELQKTKELYKSVEAGREEEYRLRCPNPSHGEYVIITLRVSDE